MLQLLNFFLKNKSLILFLFLFNLSLALSINFHDYHKTKFSRSASILTGSIHNVFSEIRNYFNLRLENDILLEENNRLKRNDLNFEINNTNSTLNEYKYILNSAKVIKNSYSLPKNFLIINKGNESLLSEDLGVITSNGIVGIIDRTTSKYSRVISILNTKSKINAKLKKSNHFGTLEWDGVDPKIVQLNDIQDLVDLKIGDSIVTSGFSSIFPENISIGKIKSFKLNDTRDLYIINVELFNDMTNLRHVYIVKNTDYNEIQNLINE